MAVAADSHRNFLIPEHTVLQYARQRILLYIQILCVYSFVAPIIPHCCEYCKGDFFVFCQRGNSVWGGTHVLTRAKLTETF